MTATGDDRAFEFFFGEMFHESDRGCILVGASVLDGLLGDLLRSQLSRNEHVTKQAVEPLFAGLGPLSSFSSRIKFAYCLGMIERWQYEDLERIRKIRNQAAHEYSPKTFTNQQVIDLCSQLKGADHAVTNMSQVPLKTPSIEKPNGPPSRDEFSKERLRFTLTVVYMAGTFHARSALQQKPAEPGAAPAPAT